MKTVLTRIVVVRMICVCRLGVHDFVWGGSLYPTYGMMLRVRVRVRSSNSIIKYHLLFTVQRRVLGIQTYFNPN